MITLSTSPLLVRAVLRSHRTRCAFALGAFGVFSAANSPLCLAQTDQGTATGTGASPVTALPPAPASTATGASASSNSSLASAATEGLRTRRTPRLGDYLAGLGGLALVFSSSRHPASNIAKAVEGDQQFSVISPFPGGGYSVLPDGQFQPGGAMQVNIPLAYAPSRFQGIVNIYGAQNRSNQDITTSNGRNGTATLGVGVAVAGYPVWVSSMFLSTTSFSQGGDNVYCPMVQLAPETRSAPAIAFGVQDVFNARIRSPFVVATKQMGEKPVFVTLGLGRGRFSGSDVFGGVSYAPTRRVSLAAEYDGLQFNVGASFALSKQLSLLASYDDLASNTHRITGRLGERYQFGANLAF